MGLITPSPNPAGILADFLASALTKIWVRIPLDQLQLLWSYE
jgi:hypothetical protein